MDPPPPAFSGRRRSSVLSGAPPPTPSPSQHVAPRKASTWDSTEAPRGNNNPTSASDISARRASATTDNSTGGPPPEYSAAGKITGRKASNFDNSGHVVAGGGGSASEIAGRRATDMDQPPWDRFCGPPPAHEGSNWAWMSEIAAITSSPAGNSILTERNRAFYTGNLNYIFDNLNGRSLAIDDLEAVMNAYGADEGSVKDIAKKIDPEMHGIFSINSHNKQTLLTQNMSFSLPRDPLKTLRQASKCFQGNLLAPLHFAGYVFDILTSSSGYLGGEPPFMLLGMYGILCVLRGPNKNGLLTTRNVETFISIWRVLNTKEAHDLKSSINEDYNGSISCFGFYNLLYRRNAFGKQRIQVFDTNKGPHDPSLFLFTLMDKDEDGFLLHNDLQIFAAIFGRSPPDEAINRVVGELDFDGDGKVNFEDFRRAMMPVLDGMTWEFWLVAILLALKL